MRGPAAALALLLGCASAAPASADRALLIGTGDYPALDPALRLAAPDSDAHRLRDALARAGFAAGNVTLMTDSEGPSPTRAAVLAALADLARTARPGEQLLIYFSGHGAQAPAAEGGLDEIFLMRDAARWNGGIAAVPGSIRDHELVDALRAIRATGASVWFVADTCHAAGLTRGAIPADAHIKAVTAADLGIPPRRSRARPSASAAVAEPGGGSFAGFYAAGIDALALERRLPLGAPAARPLSQFTYALTQAIDSGRTRSLRDLAIALNAADTLLGGGAPQPEFEGTLDAPVLGLEAARPRRFAAEHMGTLLRIAAGREEGIAPGLRFRLRSAGSGAVAGYAQASSVGLGASMLAPEQDLTPGPLEAEPVPTLALPNGGAGLLEAVAPLAGGGPARDVRVAAGLWRPGAHPTCPAFDPRRAPGELRPLDLLAPPPLGQCDVVVATIGNRGAHPLDLSPFYVDADGRLTALAFVDGGSVRIAPNETRRVAVRLLAEDRGGRPLPTGSERLVLLALAGTGQVPADLRGIAAARALRSAETLALADLGDGGALVYRWTVTPVSDPRRR